MSDEDRRYKTRSGKQPLPAKHQCLPPPPGRLWSRWKSLRGDWGNKPLNKRQVEEAKAKEAKKYAHRVDTLSSFFKNNPGEFAYPHVGMSIPTGTQDHVVKLADIDLDELDRRPKGDHALLQEAERTVHAMQENGQAGVRTSTLWLDKTGKPLVLLASRHAQDGQEIVDGFTDAEGLADFCEVQQMVHETGIDLPQITGDLRHRENIDKPFMEYEFTSRDGRSCMKSVVSGVKHHVECWTEQGNPRHGLMPSKDTIGKSTSTHIASTRYMHNIDRQSALLNKLTQRFFPKVHAREQRAAAAGRWLPTRTSNTLGLATLYNVQTATHLDRNDRWCKLTNWGKYEGGMMYLPDLNIVLQYNPGDVIIFASHCLYHAIGPWSPLQAKEGDVHLPGRVTWVHFNHQDVMDLLEDKGADWMLNYGSNSTRM